MKPILALNPVSGHWDMWIVTEGPSGVQYVVKPVVMELAPFDPGDHVEPTMKSLSSEFAGALAGALQEKGIKPPEASFVEGKLVATEKHLEDLRSLLSLKT